MVVKLDYGNYSVIVVALEIGRERVHQELVECRVILTFQLLGVSQELYQRVCRISIIGLMFDVLADPFGDFLKGLGRRLDILGTRCTPILFLLSRCGAVCYADAHCRNGDKYGISSHALFCDHSWSYYALELFRRQAVTS